MLVIKICIWCFNPDNTFVTKLNICSWKNCIIGEFCECDNEKVFKLLLSSAPNHSSDKDDEDDKGKLGYEDYEELESDYEEMYELRADSVIDIIQKNSVDKYCN